MRLINPTPLQPELKTRLSNAVFKEDCLEGSLAHILSNKLSSVNNKPQLLYKVFRKVLLDPNATEDGTPLSQHIRDDIQAVVERDEACFGPLQARPPCRHPTQTEHLFHLKPAVPSATSKEQGLTPSPPPFFPPMQPLQSLQVLIYFKGYHSIQAHRIAHALWHQGRKWMALQVMHRPPWQNGLRSCTAPSFH